MNCPAIDPSLGAWTSPITRRLTTSSTSTPRLRRLSCTACVSSAGLCAGFHDASAPRTAPTLVTIVEVVRIGVQRLADQLVGDVRAVEVAGVDVVDAARHRLAQHRERRVAVLGRPEHAGPGELHRAVAHAVHDAVAQGRRCRRR